MGPKEKRAVKRDIAWQSIEKNRFGTDEYISVCRQMGWTPMITVNMGTGTPEEARNWVEYCNSPAGTHYADMRAASLQAAGKKPEPYNVKLWCLGNEMDGHWQIGHVPAHEYAIRAQQAAKMMKDVDQSIELIVCGSSGPGMNTYMDWDREVLEYAGSMADYISVHRYVGNRENNTPDFLAVTNAIDRQIEEIDAVCRFVQAKSQSKKRVYLSFDEWNVWYKNMEVNGEGKFAPHLLEEIYNLEDALVVAGFLQSFIRHADVVKIANLAQLVNVIAPIITTKDDILIQSIFYPFKMISSRKQGVSLRTALEGPTYESAANGRVNYIDSSAIISGKKLHVFLANRSMDESMEVGINISGASIQTLASAEIITGNDPKAANTFENMNAVAAVPYNSITIKQGKAVCELPRLSFLAMTLELE